MKPILQALLLADHVYQDRNTGKWIIAGTFNRLLMQQEQPKKVVDASGQQTQIIPGGMHAGSPYLFISLTDIKGETPLDLRYVNLETNQSLLRTTFCVTCDDPLATVELSVPLPPLPIPAPGIYALELLYDQELLGSIRLSAQMVEGGSQ